MLALWLDPSLTLRSTDCPAPVPAPGEALVRVRLAGICATDLALLEGYSPFTGIPGHEFVGAIIAAPDAPERVGERVVGEINIVCGTCPTCRAGRPTHCEGRTALGIRGRNGAFAEQLTLPLGNLHPVPAGVSDEQAVFTEPLAAALAILQRLPVPPAARVLIVGAGRLGQLIARVLRLTGCELAVVARHPRQRELLAAAGVRALAEDAVPARAFDLVVEASGAPAGFVLARSALRPRGTLVLKSTFRGSVPVDLAPLVVDEITVVGSRCGPFPPALRLLAAGLVDPTPLIDARLPLAEGVAAFALAARPGALKVLLDCGRP